MTSHILVGFRVLALLPAPEAYPSCGFRNLHLRIRHFGPEITGSPISVSPAAPTQAQPHDYDLHGMATYVEAGGSLSHLTDFAMRRSALERRFGMRLPFSHLLAVVAESLI